jgi:hypothetical protein
MEITAASLSTQIAQVATPTIKRVELRLVNHKGKITEITADSPTEISDKPIEVNFQNSVLITELQLTIGEGAKGNLFVDFYNQRENKNVTLKFSFENGSATIKVPLFTTSIRIITERGIIKNPKYKLVKIEAKGFDSSEMGTLFDAQEQFANLKQDCATLISKISEQSAKLKVDEDAWQAKCAEIKTQIEEKTLEQSKVNSELNELINSLERNKAEKSNEIKNLEAIKVKLAEAETNLERLNDKAEEKNVEIDSKTVEVCELNAELQKLYSDKSLFTENLAGYSKQCDKDSQAYAMMIAIPIFFIIGLACYVIFGTSNLDETLKAFPTRTAAQIVMIRAPQAIFMSFVLGALGAFIAPYITEMREIRARRRRINEISVSLQDVVSSITKSIGLSEQDQLKLLVKLKMSTLREFFAGNEGMQLKSDQIDEIVNAVRDVSEIKKIQILKEPTALNQ